MTYTPILKINTYVNGKFQNGSTVCTPDKFAIKSRCERLKRILKANLKGVK
jgi:hypothetical protein